MTFLLDGHTHTTRWSGCSTIRPRELLDRAVEVGLDGVVLTEHERFWDPEELEELQTNYSELKIFNGVEWEAGTLHHVLVYLPDPPADGTLPRDPTKLVRDVRARGGFIASAHPYRYYRHYGERNEGISLDGVEVASSNMSEPGKTRKAHELATRWDAVRLASSDAHGLDPVGKFRTRLPREPEDEADLVELLRQGKAEPDRVEDPSMDRELF